MNRDILKLSLRSLKYNKIRSTLTTLGIIIGTAIVIIVLSVGAGIEALILKEISSITSETLFVEIQIPVEGTRFEKNLQSAQSIGSGVEITTMKIDDLEDSVRLPNIEKGYAMTIAQGKFTYENKEKTAMIWGVSTDYESIESLNLERGTFFTDSQDKNLAQVIVLGSEIKKELFGSIDPIGKKVRVNKLSYQVIGVAEEIGTKYFMNMDELVYIPIRTAQKKLLGIDHILAFALVMKDPNLIDQTISQVAQVMRRNHDIKDPGKDDFAIRTQDEAMEIIDTVTYGISILLLSLASISLIVGGVGIMNVMYVSVTERTNEIGLKKAVGAKPWAIKLQFLAESVFISLLGGIIGIAFGVLISWSISYLANLLNFDWPFVIKTNSIILAFTVSAALGIIFGYAPANKAGKMNPIDALRSV